MTVGGGRAATPAACSGGGTVEQYSAGLFGFTRIRGLQGEGLEAGVESILLWLATSSEFK